MSFEKRIPYFLNLGLREGALVKLKSYLDLLWTANEELNLISRQMTPDELLDNHVIDCLLPLKNFPENLQTVADFGSGGGLPAVIYALQFPDTLFHLYEKSNKKQDFLKRCKLIAPNLQIFADIPIDFGGVDIVIARAFKPIDVTLDISRKYYEKGGKYFLLKGRKAKIEEELLLARKKFKDLSAVVEPLTSPLLEVERHLVLIEKSK